MTNKEFFIFNSLSEFYSQYEDIVMRFVSEKVAMQDFKGALAHAEAEINERDDFAFLIKKSIRDTYKSWIPDIEPKYLNLSYSPVIRKPITVKNLTDIVVAERYKVTTFDFNTFYIRGRFKVKLDLVYEIDRSDYWKSHKYDNTIPEPQIVANRDNYYLNHNLFLWMDAEIKYEKGSHKILSIEAKFIPEPKQSAGSFGPANSNQGGQMVMAAGGAKAPTSTPAADKDQGFYLEASGGGAKKPLDGSEEDYELNDTVIFNKISKR